MLRFMKSVVFSAALLPLLGSASEVVISGRIVDTTGNPVAGVRFVVEGQGRAGSSVPIGLPNPMQTTYSRLFPGVPVDCLHYSSLSGLRTDPTGVYRLNIVFDDDRPAGSPLSRKTCADFRDLLTEGNMKLVPDPEDVQTYGLVRARGPLPLPNQRRLEGSAARQASPAAQLPLPQGGFVPGR